MRYFAFIEFRDSAFGRQASLKGTRLAVWHIIQAMHELGDDATRGAASLGIPALQVTAALTYAASYPDEIQAASADNLAVTETDLRRLIPGLQVVHV